MFLFREDELGRIFEDYSADDVEEFFVNILKMDKYVFPEKTTITVTTSCQDEPEAISVYVVFADDNYPIIYDSDNNQCYIEDEYKFAEFIGKNYRRVLSEFDGYENFNVDDDDVDTFIDHVIDEISNSENFIIGMFDIPANKFSRE